MNPNNSGMCSYLGKGWCNSYEHYKANDTNLHPPSRIVCRKFYKGESCKDPNCPYTHPRAEDFLQWRAQALSQNPEVRDIKKINCFFLDQRQQPHKQLCSNENGNGHHCSINMCPCEHKSFPHHLKSSMGNSISNHKKEKHPQNNQGLNGNSGGNQSSFIYPNPNQNPQIQFTNPKPNPNPQIQFIRQNMPMNQGGPNQSMRSNPYPNPNPYPYPYQNPNQNTNLNQYPNLNPNQNTNLNPNQNTNLNPKHSHHRSHHDNPKNHSKHHHHHHHSKHRHHHKKSDSKHHHHSKHHHSKHHHSKHHHSKHHHSKHHHHHHKKSDSKSKSISKSISISISKSKSISISISKSKSESESDSKHHHKNQNQTKIKTTTTSS
ncbi:hypothetical protein M0811_06354 [Anaeramoeba ignava]|uniref:C3H1-type domain-containing protein n=1 Tax=Anaeramoeba ignava TaxID=1746090 RepID=A0A9Q0LSA2_ANAIG|nr:hypothetical protein M0811_06354 [Anaeramoeba ignava]